MFKFESTEIPDLYDIAFECRSDSRGFFVKTFESEQFAAVGLTLEMRESFYSSSHRDVLRGFHFQVPPADHVKLVYCIQGSVLDVVIDLRRGSPAFGSCVARRLNASKPSGLLIPKGCGHAFLTLSETAMLVYNVTNSYAPRCDCGIAWNGVGFDWNIDDPQLSDRDKKFPALKDFDTPFAY